MLDALCDEVDAVDCAVEVSAAAPCPPVVDEAQPATNPAAAMIDSGAETSFIRHSLLPLHRPTESGGNRADGLTK